MISTHINPAVFSAGLITAAGMPRSAVQFAACCELRAPVKQENPRIFASFKGRVARSQGKIDQDDLFCRRVNSADFIALIHLGFTLQPSIFYPQE